MIVLDASVMIAYLDGDDEHHDTAEALLARLSDEDLAANSLTLAEVLIVPVRNGRLDQTLAALRDLEIQELGFPTDTAVRLARLHASSGAKMPDCCVLLAAEDAAAAVATFDDGLARAALRLDLPVVRA